MPDPRDPLTEMEKLIFGHDAVRDPVTGEVFEQGLHALPRDVQAAQFLKNASPQRAKLDDVRANVVTAAEVAAEEEVDAASLANPFDPFVADPIVIPTKH
jgi:hypothetical protein